MDKALAERVVASIEQCISGLLGTLPLVEEHASAEEYRVFKRAIAKVVNTIDIEVIDRVAKDYPDLKPEARI